LNLPHFYIYDASAGSGKTYTITKAYLCILLQQDKVFAFQNILAITFTNKAAAEMKQRIIKALIYFSGLGGDSSFESLLNDVSAEINLSPKDIQHKSFKVLKYLIPNYAGFEVSTIDSFNHRIIRTFAKDLNITQGFNIEMDTSPFIKEAVDGLIDDVGLDHELTTWLIDYVKYKIDNNKSGNIRLDLEDYSNLILNENNYEAIEKLSQFSLKDLKRIKLQILDLQSNIFEDLKQIAKVFKELLNRHKIDTKCFPRQTIPNYFDSILEGKIESGFNSKWHNEIHETSFYTKKYEKEYGQIIDSLRPEIEKLFLHSKAKSLEYHLTERIIKNFVPLAMINEVQYRLNKIKYEEGVLFINDFNRIISRHIKKQPAPFIYERLGEKFRHYFIDEFQDTSKLQWQNLMPLVENAITSQHDDGTSGNLYLVGDVKQSIYEWRGGDPQQFLELSQGIKNPFSIKAEKKVLGDNWRSTKEVVEFNNGFFNYASKMLTDDNHKELYAKAVQNVKQQGAGYVEVQFLNEVEAKDQRLVQRVKTLEDIVRSSLDQGYRLKDICILVRKNKMGSEIAEAFNNLQDPIPVTSQESLLISSDVKVQLLNLFLQVLNDFNEERSIDFIMFWLQFQNHKISNFHDILSQFTELNFNGFLQKLKDVGVSFEFETYNHLSLYDKTEYALRALRLEDKANAYLQFFLDEIFDFAHTKTGSMSGFLSYWEEVKSNKSISTSENADAVNVMTIHKSKGLEFPVVIYAHANFKLADLSKTEDWIELDEEKFGIPFIYSQVSESVSNLSDSFEKSVFLNRRKTELANLNTAYVAMTRAINQLYILSEPIKARGLKFEDLLKEFFKTLNVFEEEKNIYNFGEKLKQPSQIKDHKEAKSSTFESYPSQHFYSTLTAEVADHKSVEYGKHVHDIMQYVDYESELDNDHISEELKPKISEIVLHPEISKYFQKHWEVYNEIEITHQGKVFRPDRICVKGQEAVIIDYKTGAEKESHLSQLTKYKAALEAMDFAVKTSILVYIRKNIYIKSL
jgi:ATP-dependent exoDNAse (exonuclease V) beta subunit